MYSFEGDFKQKPVQSLRGASKKEPKNLLLQRTQEARQKRENLRHNHVSATHIQAFYRGYVSRRNLNVTLCNDFDSTVQPVLKQPKIDISILSLLVRRLSFFYRPERDGQRLIFVCQQVLKQKDAYLNSITQDSQLYPLKKLLIFCQRHLDMIASTSDPIAVPMRMLEVFTSMDTYKLLKIPVPKPEVYVYSVIHYLVQRGYFECLHRLLNGKVPSDIIRTTLPPTPAASSILDLIMNPISLASHISDKDFSHLVLRRVCCTFLCKSYSDQVGQFLLPAMAYGKYPFPFVDLIQALVTKTSSGNKTKRKQQEPQLEWSPWLLAAVLTLADKYIADLHADMSFLYLTLLQSLLPTLPTPKVNIDYDDSDSEEDMFPDERQGIKNLVELREECLRLLDTPSHLKCMLSCLHQRCDARLLEAVSVICHTLLSQQRITVHRLRLLYTLAFNTEIIRNLWFTCATMSTPTVTGSQTSLLAMLARGLPMTEMDVNRIVPMLSVFCSMFSHSLITLHDAEFYGDEQSSVRSMPFTTEELIPMCQVLRDACLGIIELAHPDARFTVKDTYKEALQKTGVTSRVPAGENHDKETSQWAYLFRVISSLVRQLHTRDTRRQFCPRGHWLASHIQINAAKPSQIYRAQNAVFLRRPFGTLQTLTQVGYDNDGPPLANREVKNLIILTELPFVVSFTDRVQILQHLINADKEEHQGDMSNFMVGPSVSVMIRRNYIYEDAFEKLSPENEPNMKLKMRIQLVNAAGLDEAGIDGGGIFREFLSELLKTGFDPNRGLFQYTNDRLLYPNPQANFAVENFTKHYFFLGRMLGKALYENMLVELPFASFFLHKILSRSTADLDIHHLASLDPVMYKNLLFLKTYDGDVSDLGLDFTVVNDEFGETKVEELKAGGRNITVNKNNMIEYIHLMADYRLNKQIRSHCSSFRQGMADVISLEWLQMFDPMELQVLISGAHVPIDIADLRRHTNYSGGFTEDHIVIKNFWTAVESFTDEQKRQLLKFVTSCSRPPLLGFKDLYPPFCVLCVAHEPERLPTASTCMNLLKLPEFKDLETMRLKLLYAVESGSGFELS
ncbi:ubiquitin-protein ligase E3C-like [Gigantopelta aegis]|uniref:ubiquitin-protein ligase E3C-like n=1 Tax=Gigantopelta aegis TaxID=1735272 RepID=UPI001B88E5F2|nr:ubiquitin-protein ligase E3C-like [Gigantopelta aegis]